MKNPTSQKITLTAMALVASLVLNAQAGRPTTTPTPSGALWYNGDFNGVNAIPNEEDTSLGPGQFASVYDDFIVTDPSGWVVTSVFSDNLSSTNVTGAIWEVRQGVSEGNPGTLIAAGVTLTPNVTATGRSGFGYNEYEVEVTGLSVFLPPGMYWLNVTPIGDLTGLSFDGTTSGANAVGMPPGNDQNAFINSNFFGFVFTSTANLGLPYDFSMGVRGTVSEGCDLVLVSATSRKTHGSKGAFDISLPLTGDLGIECRTGLTRNVVVMTFNNNVTGADSASSSCGTIGSVSVDPADAHNLLVTFNGAGCNASTVTVTATNVHDDQGNTLSSASASMGILVGDVTGDGRVTNGDTAQVQSVQGQQTNSSNFRDDVTLDGKINTQDMQTVRSHRGDVLP